MNRETPQDWAQLFGVTFDAADPLLGLYTGALASAQPKTIHGFSIGNTDSGYTGGDFRSWTGLGLLMLQRRALMYLMRKPGDCAKAIAASGPSGALGIAGGTIGTAAGLLKSIVSKTSIVPVVGSIISGALEIGQVLEDIVGRPDYDILAERKVLCPLSIAVTQSMQGVDAAIASGQIGPADGYAAFDQIVLAVDQATAARAKDPANTFACYRAWTRAHAAFRQAWYPRIATSSTTSKLGGALVVGAGVAGVTLL